MLWPACKLTASSEVCKVASGISDLPLCPQFPGCLCSKAKPQSAFSNLLNILVEFFVTASMNWVFSPGEQDCMPYFSLKVLVFFRFQLSWLPYNFRALIGLSKVMNLWMMQLYLVVQAGVIDFPPCPQTVTVSSLPGALSQGPSLAALTGWRVCSVAVG